MPPRSLDILRLIGVGICANGPVLLSDAKSYERKHVISLIKFDRYKDECLICCKTTSKTERVFPGEFVIDDLFGRGKSKIQPYNICRVLPNQLGDFYYLGALDRELLPKFEYGLKIAIAKDMFTPLERIKVLDSWEPFF